MKLIYKGRLPGLNEIINKSRRNAYEANKMKRDIQRELVLDFLRQVRELPDEERRFKEKVNMRIDFYEPNVKRDEDNIISGMKFINDALQEAGIIPNDSQKFLHIERNLVSVDRENPRIEIELEAVNG